MLKVQNLLINFKSSVYKLSQTCTCAFMVVLTKWFACWTIRNFKWIIYLPTKRLFIWIVGDTRVTLIGYVLFYPFILFATWIINHTIIRNISVMMRTVHTTSSPPTMAAIRSLNSSVIGNHPLIINISRVNKLLLKL